MIVCLLKIVRGLVDEHRGCAMVEHPKGYLVHLKDGGVGPAAPQMETTKV